MEQSWKPNKQVTKITSIFQIYLHKTITMIIYHGAIINRVSIARFRRLRVDRIHPTFNIQEYRYSKIRDSDISKLELEYEVVNKYIVKWKAAYKS